MKSLVIVRYLLITKDLFDDLVGTGSSGSRCKADHQGLIDVLRIHHPRSGVEDEDSHQTSRYSGHNRYEPVGRLELLECELVDLCQQIAADHDDGDGRVVHWSRTSFPIWAHSSSVRFSESFRDSSTFASLSARSR